MANVFLWRNKNTPPSFYPCESQRKCGDWNRKCAGMTRAWRNHWDTLGLIVPGAHVGGTDFESMKFLWPFSQRHIFQVKCEETRVLFRRTLMLILWCVVSLTLQLPDILNMYNFSLQYLYIIPRKCNENTQTYQAEVAILIKQQILVTNLQGNV